MAIAIHLAGTADRELLMPLLSEMAAHGAAEMDGAMLVQAAAVLTAPSDRTGPFCLLAAEGGAGLGFASLAGFFPAFDFTWGLLLQELFVTRSARGGGAARALMTAIADFARDGGYSRIDWTADAGNQRAQRFYAGLRVPVADTLAYRLDGAALREAAWP